MKMKQKCSLLLLLSICFPVLNAQDADQAKEEEYHPIFGASSLEEGSSDALRSDKEQEVLKEELKTNRLMLPLAPEDRPVVPPSDEPVQLPPPPQPLPNGYDLYLLGQAFSDTEGFLQNDNRFYFREERDVSFLAVPVRRIISTQGLGFLERGEFQFSEEDLLYGITLTFNTERLDYFSFFNQLREKYGEPKVFNPEYALWENDTVMLRLEPPLILKYLDKNIFDGMTVEQEEQRQYQEERRNEFLQNF